MSATGTWNVTLNGPTGPQQMVLRLMVEGTSLTGSVDASTGTLDVVDGTADGDNVTWKSSLTQPMPIALEFSGNIAGDAISGDVKLGSFGSATFTGSRQT